MQRVLLLGGSGMLGTDLRDTVPASVELHAPARVDVDLIDTAAIANCLDALSPDWVINAAGYTFVDGAEQDAALAHEVNASAIGRLGRLCASCNIGIVHFSSDYVFSGTLGRPYSETDAPAPINVYGRTKLEGERQLLASGARTILVRTQWLFGRNGRSFPRTMRERAMAHLPTRVVCDQLGRPTYARDLAEWTWLLTRREALGTWHAANASPTTWFDVASRIFESIGASSLLAPCTSAEYPTAARRPANSTLSTTKLEAALESPLPPWTDALDRFLATVI